MVGTTRDYNVLIVGMKVCANDGLFRTKFVLRFHFQLTFPNERVCSERAKRKTTSINCSEFEQLDQKEVEQKSQKDSHKMP